MHQAQAPRLGGRHRPGVEHHATHLAGAELGGDIRRDRRRHQAQTHFGQREARAVDGHRHVADRDQADAAAIGRAVDAADDQARKRVEPGEEVGQRTPAADALGARLVAYLGRVSETRAVRQWADGTRTIANPEDVERLRIAYRAARLITERDTPAVAQAWFQGLNPVLDDRAPALLLRDGELADVGPQVLNAARQFAAVG